MAADKSTVARAGTLTYYLRPGDAAPTRPTALFLALCESDPGAAGNMATAELAAGRVATHRIAITFTAPAGTNSVSNDVEIEHGPFLEDDVPVPYAAICRSNVRGTNDMVYRVPRTGGTVTADTGETVLTEVGDIVVQET